MKSRFEQVSRGFRTASSLAVVLLFATGFSGCSQLFANLPAIGEPAGVPLPVNAGEFPKLNDVERQRYIRPVLTAEERQKLEAELAALRARQAAEGAAARQAPR
jgi:hypothetical protein